MLSEAAEALRALIDGSQGEALEVPHPNQLKNTEMVPLTKWVRSELPSDYETNMLGGPLYVERRDDPDFGKPLTYVKGQINSVVVLDEYGEQFGETEYVVLHKVENPKVKNSDVSASKIGPFTARDLRRRFPAAFAEFEARLTREGQPLPIALLDEVPPHVVQLLMIKGARSIADFALYGDKEMSSMKTSLEAQKLHARVPNLPKYREQARARVNYVEPEAPSSRKKVA